MWGCCVLLRFAILATRIEGRAPASVCLWQGKPQHSSGQWLKGGGERPKGGEGGGWPPWMPRDARMVPLWLRTAWSFQSSRCLHVYVFLHGAATTTEVGESHIQQQAYMISNNDRSRSRIEAGAGAPGGGCPGAGPRPSGWASVSVRLTIGLGRQLPRGRRLVSGRCSAQWQHGWLRRRQPQLPCPAWAASSGLQVCPKAALQTVPAWHHHNNRTWPLGLACCHGASGRGRPALPHRGRASRACTAARL